MSNSRHSAAEPAVRGYAVTHPPGAALLPSEPGWNQLLYTASGAMTISVQDGMWTIPPHRALWLPDKARATVSNRSFVGVRSLYLAVSLSALPDVARAVTLPAFCRELLLHAVRCCPLDLDHSVDSALLTVLVDQLRQLPDAPLWLSRPTDPRAVDFVAAATLAPDVDSETLARRVGASRRTLERVFRAEAGVSLGAWRRRANILGSLDRLAAGGTVTEAATSVGYSTPSAYVAAFKRELGTTPRNFLRS
jgi:AraC-like DNA-binding protein